MKTGAIINVLDKRFRRIRRHYNNLVKGFSLDEIHDFRVEMKRLRAFLRLLDMELPAEKSLKIKGDIKKFYRTTGNIRNLQLHKQRMESLVEELSLKKPEIYFQILLEEEQQQKELALQLYEKISLQQFKEKLYESLPDKLQPQTIRNFITQKFNAFLSLLYLPGYYDEGLHDIRKILKDILYDWEYIKDDIALLLPPFFADKKNIEKLALHLGDFHDYVVAIYFLNDIYLDKIEQQNEKQVLQQLKSRLKQGKNELEEKIVSLLSVLKAEKIKDLTLKTLHAAEV